MRENFKDLKKETLKIQGFSSCVLFLVIMGPLTDHSVICRSDNITVTKGFTSMKCIFQK